MVELLIRDGGEPEWIQVQGIMHGLRSAVEPGVDLLLYSADPVNERDEIVAALGLFAAAGGDARRLVVASPNPSLEWITPVRAEGAEIILVVSNILAWQRRAVIENAIEVPRDICPHLHVRSVKGTPLCVCGMRGDFVVLVTRHFVERCFPAWSTCPFIVAAGERLDGSGLVGVAPRTHR
jgi:hypothetical protein